MTIETIRRALEVHDKFFKKHPHYSGGYETSDAGKLTAEALAAVNAMQEQVSDREIIDLAAKNGLKVGAAHLQSDVIAFAKDLLSRRAVGEPVEGLQEAIFTVATQVEAVCPAIFRQSLGKVLKAAGQVAAIAKITPEKGAQENDGRE
jgi:hypothetical protein